MNPKDKNTYTGRSAHLAVMSKLTALGYKVSVPEVDVGKDVLAFLDTKPDVTSVQVKSTGRTRLKEAGAFSGTIDVPLNQLEFGRDLYYVFVFGLDGEWVEYIVISREEFNDVRVKEGIGNPYSKGKNKHLKFRFTFREAGVSFGGVPFNVYRNSWNKLPNSPGADDQPHAQRAAGQPIHTAAQTAVTSKLLAMGCNVAPTEIDKLLAFQDEEPGFTHIRVNGGNGVPAGEGGAYTAELELQLAELKLPSDLFYVFPFHFEGRCRDFVVISRERLDDLRLKKDVGSEHVDENTGTQKLKLTFSLSKETVTCGGEDFGRYRNAWNSLPPLAASKAMGAVTGAVQPVELTEAKNHEVQEPPVRGPVSSDAGPQA
jgi:hypothetical protein